MLEPFSLAAALHSALPVNIDLPVNVPGVPELAAQASPVLGAAAAGSLHLDAIAISRAVLAAESLIAATLGVRSYEVSVSVALNRYRS